MEKQIKTRKAKKYIISVIVCIILGAGAVFWFQPFPSGHSHESRAPFKDKTDVVLCYDDGQVLMLSDNFGFGVLTIRNTDLAKQLAKYEIIPGEFAEITYSGARVVGCAANDVRIEKIKECHRLTPTEALAACTYQYRGEGHWKDFLLWQEEDTDFVMIPVNEAYYVYQSGSDDPQVFDSPEAVRDFFQIGQTDVQTNGA